MKGIEHLRMHMTIQLGCRDHAVAKWCVRGVELEDQSMHMMNLGCIYSYELAWAAIRL